MDEPVLVLGGTGMLGHKMFQRFARVLPNVWCTIREPKSTSPFSANELFASPRVLWGVDLLEERQLATLIREIWPAVVVNCAGMIKQRPEAVDAELSIALNALLPHRLARHAFHIGARVIHFSTDCVFTGTRGNYREDHAPDATDVYGRSKALGELSAAHTLTLRTSIIGRELHHHTSLLEWLLRHDGQHIQGFKRVWWSGVTTNYLSDLVARLIVQHPTLSGLYHVAAARICKYDLLVRLAQAYGLTIDVEPIEEPFLDRSLSAARLNAILGREPPGWDQLLGELAADDTPYESWKTNGMVTA